MMRVFNAFYFENNEFECAYEPLYTDFDGSGLNVDALGLGGAGVVNPEFAIDADPTNFSQLSLGIVSVTSSITQNVYFPDVYSPEDQFAITIKTDPTLVTLGLLNSIEVKAFNGAEEVFSTTVASVLNLDLLTLLQNGEQATIDFTPNVSFNRVSVTLNALLGVNLAQSLDFFGAVALGPKAPTTAEPIQEFCAIDEPTIAEIQINESASIIWYDSEFGGEVLPTDTVLEDDTFYFAAQQIDGCIGTRRLAVEINLINPDAPTTEQTNQTFCFENSPTIADLTVNEDSVIWFTTPTGGTAISEDTVLEDNTTYYTAQINNGCEGTARLAVAVTVQQLSAPTTSNSSQVFCAANNPTIEDIDVNEEVRWYTTPEGGEPLEAGTLLTTTIYYASQISKFDCESEERLAVEVTLNDSTTPTTDEANQIFCEAENPIVADIMVNETQVVWFDMADGGEAYNNNDALIDGQTYYGSTTTDGCESSQRLAVTVTIETVASPTTSDSLQEFCQVDSPTIADLAVNEDNVVWYDSAESDTQLSENDTLSDGLSYFGAIVNSNNCESTERLEVQVQISDSEAPATNDQTQEFCAANNPTIAELTVQGENIMWYSDSTSMSPLSIDTPLANGVSYFASQTPDEACESSQRLEVLAIVQDTNPPTTNETSQEFCDLDNPTIADLETNSNNVVWYSSEDGDTPFSNSDALIDDEIYYGANVDPNTGCESTERLAVTAIVNTSTNATITSENINQTCINSTVRYTTEANNENYQWTVENGTIISGGQTTDSFVDVLWSNEGNYDISVSYTPVESCSTGEMTILNVNVINCGTLTINKTSNNMSPQIGDEITFTVTVSNSGSVVFTDILVEEQIQSGFEIITFNTSTGTYSPSDALWTIPELSGGDAILRITVEVLPEGDYFNTATIISSNPSTGDDTGGGDGNGNGGGDGDGDGDGNDGDDDGDGDGNGGNGDGDGNGDGNNGDGNGDGNGGGDGDGNDGDGNGDGNNGDGNGNGDGNNGNGNDDDGDTAVIEIEVLDILVNNQFSPNNDGINDFFKINNIQNHPNSTLRIFNRYGSLVYEKKDYDNSWNGTASVSGVAKKGEVLPSETYYYVLELSNINRPITGWLFIAY